MDIYSKEGLLILVQIDHLSGELLGNVIEDFYDAGAKKCTDSECHYKEKPSGVYDFYRCPLPKSR